MGFVIQKLFYSAPNPFCIFLAEIKLMQKLLPLSFIGSYHCFWAVQVYDQIGEHVF